MQRPEVSCSGLHWVGMLSAPSGPLPSWELSPWVFSLSRSRPVCVEASIREQKWNFRLRLLWLFWVRDYSFSCFYVSCRRKPLMSILFWESGHSGASVWERKWNWGLHLIWFFVGPHVPMVECWLRFSLSELALSFIWVGLGLLSQLSCYLCFGVSVHRQRIQFTLPGCPSTSCLISRFW